MTGATFLRAMRRSRATSKSLVRRLGILEILEPRTLLSASPIDGRPYFELGPSDNVAWDQPRVTVEFVNSAGQSIGPSYTNQWLLDTGANTILAFQSTVNDMNPGPPVPPRYITNGFFEELGVGGSSLYDLSIPYQMDFAGYSGVRNTRLDTKIISDATRDISLFGPYGIVGMPAMTERVTHLDFTSFTSPDLLMKMDFSNSVPNYAGPRYSVKLDNRFEYFPEPHVIPSGLAPPAWADIPYLTAHLQQNDKLSSGNFLFDTGAQVSIINKRMAFELGLDTNADGILDSKDASFAREETIGGIGGLTTVPVFLIDQVHVPTEQGVDLVWTDLQWLVLDIDPGIDAVFGFDNMTSGWIEAYSAWAATGGASAVSSGYIQRAHLDFRGYETTGEGRIYFDFNPEIYGVVDPNAPGALVSESGEITSVSETGVTDSYTLRLTEPPTANVTVTLTGPLDQQAIAVDANAPGNRFLTFTPQNWDVPQTVLVSAINDAVAENFHRTYIRHISSSTDPRYQDVGMPRVVVNITDDDFPGVMLISTDGATQVTEGGATDTYQVVLTKAPSQNVSIGLVNVQQQVTARALVGGASELVFTPQNWNVPQTVLVTAVDDNLSEGTHKSFITHSLSTSDLEYAQAFILQENVRIFDNDDVVPPRILDIIAGSSQWSSNFIDAIDGGGLLAGNGLGLSLAGPNQLRNLPWINIDRLYLKFSEDVSASLTPNKLALVGANLSNYMPGVSIAWQADGPNVVTLRFATPIKNDRLILSIADMLTDAAGNPLDGEWDDGSSTSSGNGTAGGVFNFRINVLPGDVNNSGGVNTTDLLDDYGMRNTVVSSVADAYFDANGNGGVNTTDLLDIYGTRNTILPGVPTPPSFLAVPTLVAPNGPFVGLTGLSLLLAELQSEKQIRARIASGTVSEGRDSGAASGASDAEAVYAAVPLTEINALNELAAATALVSPVDTQPKQLQSSFENWRQQTNHVWEEWGYNPVQLKSNFSTAEPIRSRSHVVNREPVRGVRFERMQPSVAANQIDVFDTGLEFFDARTE